MADGRLENLNMDKITGFLFGYIRANIETIEYFMENFPPEEAIKHSRKFLKHIDETFDLNVHLKQELSEITPLKEMIEKKMKIISSDKRQGGNKGRKKK